MTLNSGSVALPTTGFSRAAKMVFWGVALVVMMSSFGGGNGNKLVVHAMVPRREQFHSAQKSLFPTQQYASIFGTRGGGVPSTSEVSPVAPMAAVPTPATTKPFQKFSQVSASAQHFASTCGTQLVSCTESVIQFLKTFFRKFSTVVCKQIPQQINTWVSEHPKVSYCGGAVVAASLVLSAMHAFLMHRAQKKAEYLLWDAKELVPEEWQAVEKDLLDVGDIVVVVDDSSETAAVAAMTKALRQRKDIQKTLREQVNQAKALEVATIYEKHFAEEWEAVKAKWDIDSDNAAADLAEHPRLLAKLTRNIYKTKFVALLRPDYGFGVGRSGFDLTKIVVSTKSKSNSDSPQSTMIDPQLLEQVIDDLIMTCPMEYPQIWEKFTANLRPGQTLWDRHDLILKMVKAIQIQKKAQAGRGGAVDVDSDTSSLAYCKYNATQHESVPSRRGKHASS